MIVGSGRDTRGQGNASATITMRLTPDGTGTTCRSSTDLSITGKVAQFGRGVMADVSAKLLAQFVANLERDVLERTRRGPGRGRVRPRAERFGRHTLRWWRVGIAWIGVATPRSDTARPATAR